MKHEHRCAAIKGLPGNQRLRPGHKAPTATDLAERVLTREAPNRSPA